jgi:hypothetical protein
MNPISINNNNNSNNMSDKNTWYDVRSAPQITKCLQIERKCDREADSSSLETNSAQIISLYDVICQCLVNRCWFVACYICVQPRHKEQLSVIWPHAWEQPARINRTVAMETHPILFIDFTVMHYPRSHTTYRSLKFVELWTFEEINEIRIKFFISVYRNLISLWFLH